MSDQLLSGAQEVPPSPPPACHSDLFSEQLIKGAESPKKKKKIGIYLSNGMAGTRLRWLSMTLAIESHIVVHSSPFECGQDL